MSNPGFYIYIGCSAIDEPIARDLQKRLAQDAIRAVFSLNNTQTSIGEIHRLLNAASTFILLMSPSTFLSEWNAISDEIGHFRYSTFPARRFVPVLIETCDIAVTLRNLAYVDWRGRDDSQYQNLKNACLRNFATMNSIDSRGELINAHFKINAENPRAVAVSSDGEITAFSEGYKHATVSSSKKPFRLFGHEHFISSIKITGNALTAITGSFDGHLRFWDLAERACEKILKISPLKEPVVELSLSNCGTVVAIRTQRVSSHAFMTGDYTGYEDDMESLDDVQEDDFEEDADGSYGHGQDSYTHSTKECSVDMVPESKLTTITLLRIEDKSVFGIIDIPYCPGSAIALSTEMNFCAIASGADIQICACDDSIPIVYLIGHSEKVTGVCFTLSGHVVSCSWDMTLRIWDLKSGECLTVLEGHTAPIINLDYSPVTLQVFTCDACGNVRIWAAPSLRMVNSFYLNIDEDWQIVSFAASRDGSAVVLGSMEGGVFGVRVPQPSGDYDATTYSNAKVLLVGDSGTGKTGLTMRLTEDHFIPTVSSDAHWATRMSVSAFATRHPLDAATGLPSNLESTEREIWLWDFAGQADYRLIHQLFMDETALAVLVFNPQSDQLVESIAQWNRDLLRASKRPFNKLLVAGRCDRGGLVISKDFFQRIYQDAGFIEYLETSALSGVGCTELRNAIVRNIDWERIPWTVSPRIFKLLKTEILKLRDSGVVLLNSAELQQQLELKLPLEQFTKKETDAVIGLLAGPGLVLRLDFGDIVLLQPEWINRYAAAVIRSVRSNSAETGVIDEARVLSGELEYTVDLSGNTTSDENASAAVMIRLREADEAIVLRAMHQMFIDRELCMRVDGQGIGRQLVFPSFFKKELPMDPSQPPFLVTYNFDGHAAEIYSTLIVQLWHTKVFQQRDLWKDAAEFSSPTGKRLGCKLFRTGHGNTAIGVYCDLEVQDDTKLTFLKYVHEHLLQRAQNVSRLRTYFCAKCGHPVRDAELARDILSTSGADGRLRCQKCDSWIVLWDNIEQRYASQKLQDKVRAMEGNAQSAIDNESREIILEGHARVITGESGQIYRGYTGADHGIDGEIEFKDEHGQACGSKLYLQLKSGDSYLRKRSNGQEIFRIKKLRWATYWRKQAYPVMLVIRSSNGDIRWMNVSRYLKTEFEKNGAAPKEILFNGEPFTATAIRHLRSMDRSSKLDLGETRGQ